MDTNSLLKFKEHNYTVRIIDPNDPLEVAKYQQLRYKIKVEKFRWVPAPEPGKPIEYDQYDSHSTHFGVFDPDGKLIAYSRLIIPSEKTRLQVSNEFDSLIESNVRPNGDMHNIAEVSCLLVDDEFKPPKGIEYSIAQWLYKIMYHWSYLNGVHRWYAVSEKKLIRALKFLGLPFKIIGKGKDYQGAITYPAVLDLDEGYACLSKTNPKRLDWFLEGIEFKFTGTGNPPKIL